MPNTVTLFGQFRFNSASRLLTDGDSPVSIGARAIAILDALIEAPGETVSKANLLDRAWPGLNVDDANLKVQISTLRKILGCQKDVIRTEGALGYRFVGSVTNSDCLDEVTENHRSGSFRKAATPIGRTDVIKSVGELCEKSRLVTLLGPGGIGKTTVALAVADSFGENYANGSCFVDLSQATAIDQVYAIIAHAVGGFVEFEPTVANLIRVLREKRMLLILDSTERVTEDVAYLAERVRAETAFTDILVTTREDLRVEGGSVCCLGPLDMPPPSLRLNHKDVEVYPSMQLFIRTARQGAFDCRIDDEAIQVVAEMCRMLDGIPLAIELAASNVGVLGIEGVRRSVGETASLLNMDRRTAVQRQRSMAATIDWTYSLLSDDEKSVLRRLVVFLGQFSMDDAVSIANDAELDATRVRDAVLNLTKKSFLILDQTTKTPKYHLFKTIRSYVNQLGDVQSVIQRTEVVPTELMPDLQALEIDEHVVAMSWAARASRGGREIRVTLNWNVMHEFLRRRLASFHRAGEPAAVQACLAIGSDRSARVPFA